MSPNGFCIDFGLFHGDAWSDVVDYLRVDLDHARPETSPVQVGEVAPVSS